MQLRTAPGDKVDANKITADSDGFNGSSPDELILTVLRLSIYISFFCQNCLLVVWPRVVKGDYHGIVLNVCRMLIKSSEKNTETH
jgi:hypothetical protein